MPCGGARTCGAANGAFYAWSIAGLAGKIREQPIERSDVGLFRRKPKVEDEPERCPLCNEPLPDGADECAMCGADLKALRPWSDRRVGGRVGRV